MKKSHRRVTLRRETIKMLATTELSLVDVGLDDALTGTWLFTKCVDTNCSAVSFCKLC